MKSDSDFPPVWEKGIDRIADLRVFGSTSITLNDQWERFGIQFFVFYPARDSFSHVRINGDREELGDWKQGTGPIEMAKETRFQGFQLEKFGE